MAILVNMGQRGFVLKQGFLAPGKELVVDAETGLKLSRIYKKELKLIQTEVKVEEVEAPKEEKPVVVEEVKEEVKEEAPKAKRKYTRKAKKSAE